MSIFDKFKKKFERVKKTRSPLKEIEEKKSQPKKELPKSQSSVVADTTLKEIKSSVVEGVTGVLVKPVVSEKSSFLSEQNKYVFAVSQQANKIQIKQAVKAIYKVNPIKVQVIKMHGKNVRFGRTRGRTKNWKKAIITLKEGDKIELFKGV